MDFLKSTYRWEQLQEDVGCCVKRECATRWRARADAVNVVAKNYEKIVEVLDAFDEPETHVVLNSVTDYNLILLLPFCNGVLNHINRVKLGLQDPKMNFHEVAKGIKGLGEFLQIMLEDLTFEVGSQGKFVAEKLDASEPRTRKKDVRRDTYDEIISPTKSLQQKMKSVIDRLIAELKCRFQHFEKQDRIFGFRLDGKSLLEISSSIKVLKKRCQKYTIK